MPFCVAAIFIAQVSGGIGPLRRVAGVLSHPALADARGPETLILSRDREGTVVKIMRDVTLGDVAENFSTQTCFARFLTGHEALGGRQDGYTHAAQDPGYFIHADVHAAPGL
jgi:hypothetical protein